MLSFQAKLAKKILARAHKRCRPTIEHIRIKNDNYKKEIARIGDYYKESNIVRADFEGVNVLIIDPPNESDRIVIYLHGGGFVYGLSKLHINYAESLANMTRSRVILVDYSLAPDHKFPIAVNEIQKIWKCLLAMGKDPSKIAIVGDSAGASLAISASLLFSRNNLPNPACLALFSPAVDLTLSGESYNSNEKRDIILNKEIMSFFADSYAGDSPKSNPIISPLFANLKKLPPIYLQFSSNEVLYSECKSFIDKLKNDGIETTFNIGDDLWHNWHLANDLITESRKSIEAVSKFIINKTTTKTRNKK